GSTQPVTYQLAMDLVPPEAPVIAGVTGDNVINADDARNPEGSTIIVQGRAAAGSTVVVSWHGDDQITTADGDDLWSVSFEGLDIPDGDYVIRAVAIDLAGNTSEPGTQAVSVVTGRPSRPTFDDVTS